MDSINKAVNESMGSKKRNEQDATLGTIAEIKSELQLFELSEFTQRGDNLQFAYLSLISITPTSVEPERAFSSAGNF